jgi:phosphatidylserine/phosphatidylglycerophosphate/cardiolipin synthase-like enzyme
MVTRFLFNDALWSELASRIRRARRVHAAIAYVGSHVASLLPLRPGDRLVVDMSLTAVRSGATNPREIKKLLDRGVDVFTRRNLHAKFVVIDKCVISGSANISRHAREVLDEAAIITDDPIAVRRAEDTFDKMCTEPVRQEYLKL